MAQPLPSSLPPELLPLTWLIGRWAGVGLGHYPTIEDFRFGQEVVFSTDGRPFLSYLSRSWLLDDDGNRVRPLATESGFWRPRPDNQVEVTLAHGSGIAETWSGAVTISGLENAVVTQANAIIKTDAVALTPSAKDVVAGERMYGLVNGRLLWTYDMAAVGVPMTNHLSAALFPADDTPDEDAVDLDADDDAAEEAAA